MHDPEDGGWVYEVICPAVRKQVRGLKADLDEAVEEARVWLDHFGCPARGCTTIKMP
jgi:hypothetical protein